MTGEARRATGCDIAAPSGAAPPQTAFGFTFKVSTEAKKRTRYLSRANVGDDERKERRPAPGNGTTEADWERLDRRPTFAS